MATKKSTGNVTPRVTPVRKNPPGSGGNLAKQGESLRISDAIAEFEKAGGQVEKLGVTRVLQKITPPRSGEVASAPPPAPRSKTRKS